MCAAFGMNGLFVRDDCIMGIRLGTHTRTNSQIRRANEDEIIGHIHPSSEQCITKEMGAQQTWRTREGKGQR